MRKIWLGAWFVVVLIVGLNFALQPLINPVFQASVPIQYGMILFFLILAVVLGYGGYYWAYKNVGTKFVTFCSLVTGGSVLVMILLDVLGKPVPYNDSFYYWLGFACRQGIGLLWAILCWKMRKENQKLYGGLTEPN